MGIAVEHVSKSFGEDVARRAVIADCSFDVADGKLTVLIGPSGCGKTTLINLIAGYEQPDGGQILLDGAKVGGPAWDRLVVFQETALFPWMTVLDNVTYGPSVRRERGRAEIEADALALLGRVGLRDFRDKYPNHLSGGMQRRAELARALINRPRVLLMDEPFRGLDAMTRELMQEYLLRLFEGAGQTILFVTSEIDEALLLADRLVMLSRGPTRTKRVIDIDLPRPRSLAVVGTPRFAALKGEALSELYDEAVQAFTSGSRAARDMVEAFRRGAPSP